MLNLVMAVALAASIRVSADPAGAVVEVDGEKYAGAELAEGPHRLAVWKRGYTDYLEVIDIGAVDAVRKVKLARGISAEGEVRARPFVDELGPQNQGWVETLGVWRADVKDQGENWNVHGRLEGGLPKVWSIRIDFRGEVVDRDSHVFGVRWKVWDKKWRTMQVIGYESNLWYSVDGGVMTKTRSSGGETMFLAAAKRFEDGWVEVKNVQVTELKVSDLVSMKLLKPGEE